MGENEWMRWIRQEREDGIGLRKMRGRDCNEKDEAKHQESS